MPYLIDGIWPKQCLCGCVVTQPEFEALPIDSWRVQRDYYDEPVSIENRTCPQCGLSLTHTCVEARVDSDLDTIEWTT